MVLTILLIRMGHHLDVFGYREGVIELACRLGCGVMLNVWAPSVAYKSAVCQGG
jgi:hypothetical protein